MEKSRKLIEKEKYLTEAKACEQRINELQELQRRYEKGCKENSKLETIVEKYKNFDNLTEEIIQSFISKVVSYPEKISLWKRRNMMKKLQDWNNGCRSFRADGKYSRKIINR